ncbi:MAG: ferrous iron transport protein A [Chloroflexaceae bacterium]|nr:ferrous iron transport protein A [Chloroflexaceae bacterium]
MTPLTQTTVNLSLIPPGQRVRVVNIPDEGRASHRLSHLGIVRGAQITIVQDNGSSLLIAVGATRLALARGLAHTIRVALEEEQQ